MLDFSDRTRTYNGASLLTYPYVLSIHCHRYMLITFFSSLLSRFQNGPCETFLNNQDGVCYTVTECLRKGGRQSGTCANGFGVCCACTCPSLKIKYFQIFFKTDPSLSFSECVFPSRLKTFFFFFLFSSLGRLRLRVL